jgi:uncharacterized protein (DUF983 family)
MDIMDDKTLAFLGDREAAERLTAAGVLLECPLCGSQPILFGGTNIAYVKCDKCGLEIYRMDKDGDDIISKICSVSPKHEAVLAWNTRTPVLTPAQLALLKIGAEWRT